MQTLHLWQTIPITSSWVLSSWKSLLCSRKQQCYTINAPCFVLLMLKCKSLNKWDVIIFTVCTKLYSMFKYREGSSVAWLYMNECFSLMVRAFGGWASCQPYSMLWLHLNKSTQKPTWQANYWINLDVESHTHWVANPPLTTDDMLLITATSVCSELQYHYELYVK